MFSVVKVRDDVARGDYKDPGLVQAPAGHGRLRITGQVPRAGARLCAESEAGCQCASQTGHSGH